MTKVFIFKKSSGQIAGFQVSGHTGFAENGTDIVCAAISAVTQTAVLGLSEIAGLPVKTDIADGWLRCMLPSELTEEERIQTETILKTMQIGLETMKIGYSKYMKIEEREVE